MVACEFFPIHVCCSDMIPSHGLTTPRSVPVRAPSSSLSAAKQERLETLRSERLKIMQMQTSILSRARSTAGTPRSIATPPPMLFRTAPAQSVDNGEVDRLHGEIRQLKINEELTRERVAALEAEVRRVESDKERLSKQLSDSHISAKPPAGSEEAIDKLKQQLAREKDRVFVLCTEKQKLEEEVQDLRVERFNAQKLAAEVDALKHQLGESSDWHSEKANLVSEVDALRQANETLSRQAKTEKSQRLVLQAKLEQMQKELDDSSRAEHKRASTVSSIPPLIDRRMTVDSEAIKEMTAASVKAPITLPGVISTSNSAFEIATPPSQKNRTGDASNRRVDEAAGDWYNQQTSVDEEPLAVKASPSFVDVEQRGSAKKPMVQEEGSSASLADMFSEQSSDVGALFGGGNTNQWAPAEPAWIQQEAAPAWEQSQQEWAPEQHLQSNSHANHPATSHPVPQANQPYGAPSHMAPSHTTSLHAGSSYAAPLQAPPAYGNQAYGAQPHAAPSYAAQPSQPSPKNAAPSYMQQSYASPKNAAPGYTGHQQSHPSPAQTMPQFKPAVPVGPKVLGETAFQQQPKAPAVHPIISRTNAGGIPKNRSPLGGSPSSTPAPAHQPSQPMHPAFSGGKSPSARQGAYPPQPVQQQHPSHQGYAPQQPQAPQQYSPQQPQSYASQGYGAQPQQQYAPQQPQQNYAPQQQFGGQQSQQPYGAQPQQYGTQAPQQPYAAQPPQQQYGVQQQQQSFGAPLGQQFGSQPQGQQFRQSGAFTNATPPAQPNSTRYGSAPFRY